MADWNIAETNEIHSLIGNKTVALLNTPVEIELGYADFGKGGISTVKSVVYGLRTDVNTWGANKVYLIAVTEFSNYADWKDSYYTDGAELSKILIQLKSQENHYTTTYHDKVIEMRGKDRFAVGECEYDNIIGAFLSIDLKKDK